jgi:acyl-CoA synthetase (NDP forming)
MIGLQRESSKPMFLSWLGDAKVSESRDLFSKAKCAHFRAPEYGIEVFRNLASYQYNQQLLLQTPGPLEGKRAAPDLLRARAVIAGAMAEGGLFCPNGNPKKYWLPSAFRSIPPCWLVRKTRPWCWPSKFTTQSC